MGALFFCLLAAAADAAPPLTTAAEIRALTPAEAALGRAVRLRGVATYERGAGFSDFALQDASGGVMTEGAAPGSVRPGAEVVVEGVTSTRPPGPRVLVRKLTVLGQPGLPPPLRASVRELVDGGFDGLYVEASGVVRASRVEPALEPPRLTLELGPPGQRVGVWISRFGDAARAQLRPDTAVTIRGVCLAWSTAGGQRFSTFLVVNHPDDVTVTGPPAADALALPETSVPALLSSRFDEAHARLTRVRGVVTLHWPGELLVLQNATGAVRLRPAGAVAARPGDEVSVAGFPTRGASNVELEQAIVGPATHVGLPRAEVVTAKQLIEEAGTRERDARLVRLRGVLQDLSRRDDQQVLTVVSDGRRFEAGLPERVARLALEPGTSIELTGAARMLVGRHRALGKWPDHFDLQLPDGGSVVVLAAPPWWTPRRLLMGLGLAGAVLALALSWAFTLRRRVETRTALLGREVRARHDAEVLAAERARLAADLHDGIAQTLTGAAFQLEVALAARDPGTHLSLARRLLDRGRDDLRRAVWDLTPGGLLERDLPEALAEMGREATAGASCTVEVRTEGAPIPLPDRLRAHLFRVGQEAISNAVRHAKARRIDVLVSHAAGKVVLTVADDGRGFDPATAPGPEAGHFGLRALRERVRGIGGELDIESGATGTRLVATVPLPREAA